MKSYKQEHELMRRKIWIEAWTSVSNANDCKSPLVATEWADDALKNFDIVFQSISDGDINE